jgi:hypothetical protein
MLLVPGNELGDSQNTCYLGVFGTEVDTAEPEVWKVGTIFFSMYYIVYDASQPYRHQIGIAPKAKELTTPG